jgi:hypothetical protein
MNASLTTHLRLIVKKSHPLCILRDGRIVKLQETISFWEKLLAVVAHKTTCVHAGKSTWASSFIAWNLQTSTRLTSCCHCMMFRGNCSLKKNTRNLQAITSIRAVCLPLSQQKDESWRHKDSTAAVNWLHGRLPGLLENHFGDSRNILHQLLSHTRALSSVWGNMAWQMFQGNIARSVPCSVTGRWSGSQDC